MRSLGYTLLIVLATIFGYALASRIMEESRDFR